MSTTTTSTIEIDDAVLNQRGKKYKAVAFRQPKQGELAVNANGSVGRWAMGGSEPRLVIEEIGPFLVTDGKCLLAVAERDGGEWFECRMGSFTVTLLKRHDWRRVTDDEMTSLGGALELLLKFRAEAK